jgi:hypothetical protein
MSQTYDVLHEMLDDVILQQNERERFEPTAMHEHLAQRLHAIELPPKGRMETRFNRPVRGVDVDAVPFFELRQMMPAELVSPLSPRTSASLTSSGELSVPENKQHAKWRKKHKAYKILTKQQRRTRRNFLHQRQLASKFEEKKEQERLGSIAQAQAQSGILGTKFHDMTSSDSGTFGFITPNSSLSPQSANDNTSGNGSDKEKSSTDTVKKGGNRSRSRKNTNRKNTNRKNTKTKKKMYYKK